jgi:uncharacterized protein YecE (DUF72 family)
MDTLPLFDPPEPAERSPLAARLSALAERGVYFGTSSWKYPGWLGSIYTPERYFTRGRFSQKKFEAECLAEYAETFPAVCGDFSFYQFPSDSYWHRLFASAPPHLKFAFKVPEEITVRTWPTHERYGARGGSENESFLNAGVFERMFARPLELYANRVAALIFEFGTLPKRSYENVQAFARDLARFLEALPRGWRYGVEVRNPEYLDPVYFDCLRAANVAHVFNAWTRMPELREQIAIEAAHTADFTIARALLRHGRPYARAVEKFQPYDRIQDPNPAGRSALRDLLDHATRRKQVAFLFVNNRFEGNAPGTIAAVTE